MPPQSVHRLVLYRCSTLDGDSASPREMRQALFALIWIMISVQQTPWPWGFIALFGTTAGVKKAVLNLTLGAAECGEGKGWIKRGGSGKLYLREGIASNEDGSELVSEGIDSILIQPRFTKK